MESILTENHEAYMKLLKEKHEIQVENLVLKHELHKAQGELDTHKGVFNLQEGIVQAQDEWRENALQIMATAMQTIHQLQDEVRRLEEVQNGPPPYEA